MKWMQYFVQGFVEMGHKTEKVCALQQMQQQPKRMQSGNMVGDTLT